MALLSVKRRKWELAQRYERHYWLERLGTDLDARDLEQIRKFEYDNETYPEAADTIRRRIERFVPIGELRRVLQVGNALMDVIDFWPCRSRHAIDPLAHFFAENYPSVGHSDGPCQVSGMGEAMPYKSDLFDLVILTNVLDHTQCADKVLSEGHRVLRDGGFLYLSTNTWDFTGSLLRTMLSRLGVDEGHPHTFKRQDVDRLLTDQRFVILERVAHSRSEQRELMRQSGVRILQLLSFLNIPVYHYACVARKGT